MLRYRVSGFSADLFYADAADGRKAETGRTETYECNDCGCPVRYCAPGDNPGEHAEAEGSAC